MDSHTTQNESIGDLLRGIIGDLRALVKEEIAMARLEIGEQVARARTAGISVGITVLALLMGGLLLLVAASLGIADLLDWPTWAGFLVVAVMMIALGVAAGLKARQQLSLIQTVPEKTINSLKENAEWISKRLSSAQR